jgi:hypothetical protein
MQPGRVLTCIHVLDEILLSGLVRAYAYLVFSGLGYDKMIFGFHFTSSSAAAGGPDLSLWSNGRQGTGSEMGPFGPENKHSQDPGFESRAGTFFQRPGATTADKPSMPRARCDKKRLDDHTPLIMAPTESAPCSGTSSP